MEARGRKLGRRQDSKESRDSSVSSTSREVRCGCQYFQSDSLLPERHPLVGTRPSSRNMNMGDHEYEPINPPSASQQAPPSPPSPPLLKVMDQEEQEKDSEPERIDFRPIFESRQHQYLRIPLDRDMVIPIDKAEIESLRYDDEEEEEPNKMHEITMEDVQDREEARNFAATPATTISRTDGEFNTSQMDSSGLDELPLKREARRGFNARGFQQRISSQAGRLRTRIRNISRPKINFPERPKFNLPERPKMNFERPKFNFPERPKFNLKRPDLKMPNFNFGKTKTSSIRRPLRDRTQIPSNQSTAGSKKNIFDSINFRTYPRIFSKKKKAAQGRRALTPPPRMETESTPPSTPGSRTGPINQRWTQRFRDIKFADSDNQSDLKKPSFEDDVEDDSAAFRDPDFKTVVTFDNESKQKAESSISIPGSDREQHSSGSSSERHRAGVIEEIDSDEFFVRQKGLSREDVDVSRYLSLEIRDAFRSPKNALASLGREEYDEDEGYDNKLPKMSGEPIRLSMEAIRNQSSDQIRMTPERDIEYTGDEEFEEEEPVRPERTRSLKKHSNRSKSEELKPEIDNQFNTFPPNRPTRIRKQSSQSKHSIPVDYEDEKENVQDMRPPSIPSLHVTDTTKEMSPTRYIDESSEALDEPWVEEPQPPLPPKRRKSTRDSSQDKESLRRFQQEQWMEEDAQADDMVLDNVMALQREADQSRPIQNGYYDSPPPPPMRKSRSQGTSLAEDDRTSRGAESLISESRSHLTEDLGTKPDFLPVIMDSPGYAFIEKTVIEAEPKQPLTEKPKRPPPPSRRRKTAAQLAALKNQSINFFFTYPRRAIKKKLHRSSPPPLRPVRNYSTIGPTRPPRRNRVFREPVYEGEFIPLKDENEIQDTKEKEKLEYIDNEIVNSIILDSLENDKLTEKFEQEEVQERDLQSEDVIEKMKDRPLPPPPRPPRKTREEEMKEEDDARQFTEEEVETTDLDEQDIVVSERIDILVAHPHHDESKKEKTPIVPPVEEICERQVVPEIEQTQGQAEVLAEPPVKTERRKKSLSLVRKIPTPAATVEATVSTQTDTLSDGFYVEEEQQTSADYSRYEELSSETPRPVQEPEVEKKVETIIEHKVVVIPTPETEILKAKKIHVAELDVDKLNVTELQAQKITVSDIDGVSMQVAELTSKSGHLVISGFELPSSFLEAITPQPPPAPVIHIQSSTQTPPQMADSQTNTTPVQEVASPYILQKESPASSSTLVQPTKVQPLTKESPVPSPLPAPPSPPRRPSPPPTIVIHSPHGQHVPGYVPSSPPPRSPTKTRSHHDSDEELRMVPRRRRHHSHKHATQLSTDEEEEEEFPSYPIARRPHQREPTAVELIRQLLGIWHTSASRAMNHVIEVLNAAFPDGEKRKDAQTAACIVLVLIAGLLLLGFGQDRTVHHHHWDFLPPHP